MTTKKLNVLAMCICAGGVSGFAQSEESPTVLNTDLARVRDVAHIYFNIASGERVITLIDDGQTVPADNGTSGPIWSIGGFAPCGDPGPGFTSTFFYAADDNSVDTALATHATTLDWGDLSVDTVVDCVSIHWVTDHDDVDADSDGIGDGVVGLAGEWTWWDVDNGRNNCIRMPLISILLTDLPGDTSGTTDPDDPENTLAKYTADIDLASSLSSSLVFEFGDTDSDPQGAVFHHAGIGNQDNDFDGLPDSDLDGDGLFDFSWGVQFTQPGTGDLDGDGVIDGDFADSMKAVGLSFGLPAGEALDNGDGTWDWVIDPSSVDAGTGSEDAFVIYAPDGTHAGFFWFDGFSCEPGDFRPRASFEHTLFGPSNPGSSGCAGDLNGDGEINFFDVALFLEWFGDSERCDYNDDGECNFFDIAAFLEDISEGCNGDP